MKNQVDHEAIIPSTDVFIRVTFADWRRLCDAIPCTPTLAPEDVVTAVVRRIEGLRSELAREVNSHDALVNALRLVETALFAHASAGMRQEKIDGKMQTVPVDDEQHPWIPGADAWPIVEGVRAALALAEAQQ